MAQTWRVTNPVPLEKHTKAKDPFPNLSKGFRIDFEHTSQRHGGKAVPILKRGHVSGLNAGNCIPTHYITTIFRLVNLHVSTQEKLGNKQPLLDGPPHLLTHPPPLSHEQPCSPKLAEHLSIPPDCQLGLARNTSCNPVKANSSTR